MNLPDFRNHNELNKLRELMRAQYIPDIKRKLIEGISLVRKDEVRVDVDGTFLYKRQNVVLYIQNAKYYIDKWNKFPKYHIVDCETLNLKGRQQYSHHYLREGVGRPEIGLFTLNLSDNPQQEELKKEKLEVCENCLEKLELKYKSNGENYFVFEPDVFPLSDWFDAIDDGYEPLPIDRIRSDGSYYIAAWRFLSWLCRKNAHWKCQGCGIELGHERSDRRFLHAHHTKGTRYNKLEDLIALCIHCHSKQERVGHSQLTSSTDYQEFMKKYEDNIQTRNQKNLQGQQSTAGQEYNTFSLSQDDTTDEDLPF